MVGLAGCSLKTGLRRRLEALPQIRDKPTDSQATLLDVWRTSDRLSDEQIAAALDAYRDEAAAHVIAAELKLSKSATLDLLRKKRTAIRPHTRLSDADVVEAAGLYESGLYLRQVAERFGDSTECVRKRLVAAGAQMRPDRGGRRPR